MSSILIVIDNPKDWPLNVEGVDCISARKYLTDPTYSLLKTAKVFNLCKSYRYQNLGYYVSLLAQARGHKILPNIWTVQNLKQSDLARGAGLPAHAGRGEDIVVERLQAGTRPALVDALAALARRLTPAFPTPSSWRRRTPPAWACRPSGRR